MRRQFGDDVLDDAVGEVFLLRIAAHVLERQHGDRRLVGQGKRRCRRRRGLRAGDRKHMDRPRQVLERDLALVLKAEIELVAHLSMDFPRDGNATRLGDAFDARSDVDAVAHQIIALHNDVADMDADAQRQFPSRVGLLDCPRRLTACTALANSTRKPSPTALNRRPACLAIAGSMTSVRSVCKLGQRSCLVATDKLRVADHIGHQDRGEAALLAHSGKPARRSAFRTSCHDISRTADRGRDGRLAGARRRQSGSTARRWPAEPLCLVAAASERGTGGAMRKRGRDRRSLKHLPCHIHASTCLAKKQIGVRHVADSISSRPDRAGIEPHAHDSRCSMATVRIAQPTLDPTTAAPRGRQLGLSSMARSISAFSRRQVAQDKATAYAAGKAPRHRRAECMPICDSLRLRFVSVSRCPRSKPKAMRML